MASGLVNSHRFAEPTVMTSFDPSRCARCGTSSNEAINISVVDRKPCVMCGSLARAFSVSIRESVTIRKKLRMRQKRHGYKRPIFESVSGDDLHYKSGRWTKLTRSIDRENNHYREIVIDPETGEIIHSCDEPLTDHWNHGNAKRKKS